VSRDWLGLKVEDESDKWTQPGRDTGARGRPISGCCEAGRADAGRASAWAEAGHWAAQRRKGEGSRQAVGGGREKLAEPETGRGRRNPFPFSKFIFCSTLLKRIFKPFKNKRTPLNKIYAAA